MREEKPTDLEPTALPYGQETLKHAWENLFQHRAMTHALPRKSTTVFNSRWVDWGPDTPGQSIGQRTPSVHPSIVTGKTDTTQLVYNCKSDDESLAGDGDVVLSATCFTATPITYGVLYGCNTDIMNRVTNWLKRCKKLAFHPLILPMVFVELERKRLLNAMESKSSELDQRILDMEHRLQTDKAAKQENNKKSFPKKDGKVPTMTDRDCETIRMSLAMSDFKNGLEGLLTQILSMRNHLGKPSDKFTLEDEAEERERNSRDSHACGVEIDIRLKDITAELQSKLRSCNGRLEAITLATQMVQTLAHLSI